MWKQGLDSIIIFVLYFIIDIVDISNGDEASSTLLFGDYHPDTIYGIISNAAGSDDSGQSLFEGDMILTEDQLDSMGTDIDFRAALRDTKSHWPNGVISYKLDATRINDRQVIVEAMNLWQDNTCVSFRESPANEVTRHHIVIRHGIGCNSPVGFTQGVIASNVSLDDGCVSVPVVAHELGHAIGLYHEQNRPDRNQYLNVYTRNADQNMTHNFVLLNTVEIDSRNSAYDFGSIMQYDQFAFSNNDRMTLVPLDPFAEVLMDRAKVPSFEDYKVVNIMYNCTIGCGRLQTRCLNGGYAAVNTAGQCRCLCRPGFGGPQCRTRQPTPPACVSRITRETTIQSPNYPNSYPGDKDCVWWIQAPFGLRVQITFDAFEVLQHHQVNATVRTCPWDYLRIRASANVFSDDPGDKYCGNDLILQPVVTSRSQEMILIFRSYNQVINFSRTGFHASVRFV